MLTQKVVRPSISSWRCGRWLLAAPCDAMCSYLWWDDMADGDIVEWWKAVSSPHRRCQCSEVGCWSREIGKLRNKLGLQRCIGYVAGRLRLDFHDDWGVPAKTPMLKLAMVKRYECMGSLCVNFWGWSLIYRWKWMRMNRSTSWSSETASRSFNGVYASVNLRYMTASWGWGRFLFSSRFGPNFSSHTNECFLWVAPSWASMLHRMMPDLGLRRPRMLSNVLTLVQALIS